MERHVRRVAWSLGVLLLLSACQVPTSGQTSVGSNVPSLATGLGTSLPPVENRAPNAPYQAAFDGQTRAPGLETTSPYQIDLLRTDLRQPWAVTALPDGRLVITEKAGTLRLFEPDTGTLSEPITGFPAVDDRSQGGLLDVAPSPDFLESRLLYFTLAERTNEGSVTAVGKAALAKDERSVEGFTIIYRALPYYNNSMHFGSRLAFDAAGNLFVTTGERSDRGTRALAQTLDNGYGKVLHITVDGEAVAGGPFAGEAGALDEIYTYGHRNVQGLAIHPLTGDVWIGEMGPRGGDELNLLVAGGNYGWGEISYGLEYSGAAINRGETSREGMMQPVYYWDPVLAPSGMAFYTSDAIPEWENHLFIGGLASQHISRLQLLGERVVGEERLMEGMGERIRDVGMGARELYVVTDSGNLYRLGP